MGEDVADIEEGWRVDGAGRFTVSEVGEMVALLISTRDVWICYGRRVISGAFRWWLPFSTVRWKYVAHFFVNNLSLISDITGEVRRAMDNSAVLWLYLRPQTVVICCPVFHDFPESD